MVGNRKITHLLRLERAKRTKPGAFKIIELERGKLHGARTSQLPQTYFSKSTPATIDDLAIKYRFKIDLRPLTCGVVVCSRRNRLPLGRTSVIMAKLGGVVTAPMKSTTFGCRARSMISTSFLQTREADYLRKIHGRRFSSTPW
jgi:hypothetical protein